VDPVAQTFRWMAAARARESERPYRLFDDLLGAALAAPEGFAWLDRMEPTPGFGGPALYVVSFAPATSTTFYFMPLVDASSSRTTVAELL
jgi:O-methyltransferase involved in polyketide biosynthesis